MECIWFIRIKYLVAGHDCNKVFSIAQINDVMRPSWYHVNTLDFISAYLELDLPTSIDVSFLDQTMAMNNNELFPLAVMPMLSFGDTWPC